MQRMEIQKVVPKSSSRSSSKGKKRKQQHSCVKVVYISTPMKVKTSASQFRKLVQELTGRDSDIARLMMEDNNIQEEDNGVGIKYFDVKKEEKLSARESPSSDGSSECLSIDGILKYQEQSFVEEQLMFPLDFLYDSSQFDVLGSYDELY